LLATPWLDVRLCNMGYYEKAEDRLRPTFPGEATRWGRIIVAIQVFRFTDQLAPLPQGEWQVSRPKGRIPRPDGIVVVDDGEWRRIVQRWFFAKILFLVFFCIAWDSFLVFWISM